MLYCSCSEPTLINVCSAYTVQPIHALYVFIISNSILANNIIIVVVHMLNRRTCDQHTDLIRTTPTVIHSTERAFPHPIKWHWFAVRCVSGTDRLSGTTTRRSAETNSSTSLMTCLNSDVWGAPEITLHHHLERNNDGVLNLLERKSDKLWAVYNFPSAVINLPSSRFNWGGSSRRHLVRNDNLEGKRRCWRATHQRVGRRYFHRNNG